jgi:hypothetical protein
MLVAACDGCTLAGIIVIIAREVLRAIILNAMLMIGDFLIWNFITLHLLFISKLQRNIWVLRIA